MYSGDRNHPYERTNQVDNNFDGMPDYYQQEPDPNPTITTEAANAQNGSSYHPTPQELAGVEPDEEDLLEETYRLDNTEADRPSTSERSVAKSPFPRTVLVAGALGFIVIIGILFTLFNRSGNEQIAEETETPDPTEQDAYTQSDEYKSQLALIDQDEARNEEPARPQVSEPIETETSEAPAEAEEATPVSTSSPPPRPIPAPEPEEPAPTAPRGAPPAPRPDPPEEEIDPFVQWRSLSSAGSQGSQFALVPPVTPETTANPNTANSEAVMAATTIESSAANDSMTEAEAASFPIAVVGDNPVGSSAPKTASASQTIEATESTTTVSSNPAAATEATPQFSTESQSTTAIAQEQTTGRSAGARGILERQTIEEQQALEPPQQTQEMPVVIGSTVPAELAVPIVAAPDGETLGRFAVRLKEPLQDVQGRVALPAGTMLITDVLEIDGSSLAIQQSVVALVYEDRQGRTQQETITPDTLIIRGSNGGALIAARQGGGSSLGDDILAIGGASALAEVGAALNDADIFQTTTSSTDGDRTTSATTISNSGDSNIFGAALEGFFGATSELLLDEAEAALNNDDTDPVLVVEDGEHLQVFVNGFLTVRR